MDCRHQQKYSDFSPSHEHSRLQEQRGFMKTSRRFSPEALDRRNFLATALGAVGASAAVTASAQAPSDDKGAEYLKEVAENERLARSKDVKPMIGLGDKLKIMKVETIFVKPRWLFLKIHTNAGITGLGEPIVEGRAKTVATAIEELTP